MLVASLQIAQKASLEIKEMLRPSFKIPGTSAYSHPTHLSVQADKFPRVLISPGRELHIPQCCSVLHAA